MKNTQNIASLIARLEYEVGKECFNPNSYDGYTGVEGLGYRYPVKVYQKKSMQVYKNKISKISPSEIYTMKYVFGSNHLFMDSKQSLLSYELELYKNLYEIERTRRQQNSDKVFKAIPIIVSFSGAVLWLISQYQKICRPEWSRLQFLNLILVILCSILMIADILIFFYVIYGYKETSPNIMEIRKAMADFKEEENDEITVIAAMNKSLMLSYKDAVQKLRL